MFYKAKHINFKKNLDSIQYQEIYANVHLGSTQYAKMKAEKTIFHKIVFHLNEITNLD